MAERICLSCDGDMAHRRKNAKYCSKHCAYAYAKAHETRLCSVPMCTNKRWAKDMCSTHNNQSFGEDKRHPKQSIACVVCATPVRRRKDSEQRYQATCSVSCRTIVQWGEQVAQTGSAGWRVDAVCRARKYGARVVDVFDREVIFERDSWLCQDCGIQCAAPNPYDRTAATVDHVVPLAAGGDHSKANCQTLCLSCNARKADRLDISPAA